MDDSGRQRLQSYVAQSPLGSRPAQRGLMGLSSGNPPHRPHGDPPLIRIHTGDAETYRPIAGIVAELDAIEAEARETDTALRKILEQIGV